MKRLVAVTAVVCLISTGGLARLSAEGRALDRDTPRLLPAPTITSSSVDGQNVIVFWSWSFDDHWWEVVSFNVKRNGASLNIGIARAQPYLAGEQISRGIIDRVPSSGNYTYCVDVLARGLDFGTEQSTACVDVTVAPGHEIVIIGGNGQGGSFNKNAHNLTLGYELHSGGAAVTDCATAVDIVVSPAATIHQHNCDPGNGKRQLIIENPARGDPTGIIVSFMVQSSLVGRFVVNSR